MSGTKQRIISGDGSIGALPEALQSLGAKKLMLVCGGSFDKLGVKAILDRTGVPYVRFDGFSPNPTYEQAVDGVETYRTEGCDAILAVGGGSAMDVAKCIKIYSRENPDRSRMPASLCDTGVPLVAIPTTAGTGSESTRYAVVYFGGEKMSVTHDSIVPDVAILEPALLYTLPLYQKKCTLLDALCQAIEAWWSVNSNAESVGYSKEAIELIMANIEGYLAGDAEATASIMQGSNLAGRAINITRTTAAHAMSYKLTSLYSLPHGHAVAVCLPKIWRYMCHSLAKGAEECTDARSARHILAAFSDIARAMGGESVEKAIERFEALLESFDLGEPTRRSERDIDELAGSVNADRLGNNPVRLTEQTLRALYCEIVK